MKKVLEAVKSMDASKQSKQMPFEEFYTESLKIHWVMSLQNCVTLHRQTDMALGSVMLAKHVD